MLLPRSVALASALFLMGRHTLGAQAQGDSAARAVAAAERALAGRAITRRTIAVLPFSVQSQDTTLATLGYGLAEFLSDDLAQSHRLTMIERFRLPDLQRESALTSTASADEATRVRIGRLVAAQHMISGAIEVPASGPVSIDAHAVDVATSTVGMRASASSPLDAIFRAERDLAMQTFSAFGITLTADEKRALYERVAPQFRAFVAFSRGVQAEQQGNDDAAAASYQEAATLDRSFTLAAKKVSSVRQRIVAHIAAMNAGARADNNRKQAPDPGGQGTDASGKGGASSAIGGAAPAGAGAGALRDSPKDGPAAKKASVPAKRAHARTPVRPA